MAKKTEVIVRFKVGATEVERRIPDDIEVVERVGEALDVLYQDGIIDAWEMKNKTGERLFFPRR